MAEIIDFPVNRERRMKAELRSLLEDHSGGGSAQPPGGEKRKGQKPKPETDDRWMHVEVTGDRPQTFIVRGDLYINFGPERPDHGAQT